MRTTTLALLLVALPSFAHAGDWPGWRGPRGDGVSEEKAVPIEWSSTDNIAWKTPIPGKGHSSPIVWGDRIFVTTCIEEDGRRLLLCLDRCDGRVLWTKEVLRTKLEPLHHLNSRASSTPATDGRRVFLSFLDPEGDGRAVVGCYDFAGNRLWQKSPGPFSSKHGFCSSPVLYKDTVIVNCDHDGDGYVVCLAAADGAERWRIDRPNKTRSYCAPLIVDAGGRKQLVMSGSKCVASYDPDTGRQLWINDGPTEQFVSSLVYLDGIFFLTAGFPTYHYVGLRPDGHVAWHHEPPAREGAYVPSPIAASHWFFAVSDEGWCNCFEARTGERKWLQRLGRHHSASPVLAESRLYFTADNGDTYVVKASDRFEVICKNRLGEECYASPAIARGQIFIRATGHLYCIGK
jgi:outer membrane protein assembly factor BamB